MPCFGRKPPVRYSEPRIYQGAMFFHDYVIMWSVDKLSNYLQEYSHDVDVDIKNSDGQTALQVLTETKSRTYEDVQKIDLLLKHGANPLLMTKSEKECFPSSILARSFVTGDYDLIMKYLRYVDDIHQPIELRSHRCPIHCAIENGHLDVLRYLVQKGANVKQPMDDNITPIHLSMNQKNTEMTIFLIQNGVDINVRNSRGDTTLHWANYWPYTAQHTRILLHHKADVTITDPYGRTPLHLYLQMKADKYDVCEKMMRLGVDPKSVTNDGETLLHCLSPSSVTVPTLATNKIARMLIRYGCDVNAQDSNGNTALHMSALSSTEPYFHCLLRQGADINITNDMGCTPFELYASGCFSRAKPIFKHLTIQERMGKFTFGENLMNQVNKSEDFKEYLSACRKELDSLAICKLSKDVSFSLLDVLTSPQKAAAGFSRHSILAGVLLRFKIRTYHIFGPDLCRHFDRVSRRKRAEATGALFLRRVSNDVLNLHCCEHIMKFIATHDLEKLVDCMTSSKQEEYCRNSGVKRPFWQFL